MAPMARHAALRGQQAPRAGDHGASVHAVDAQLGCGHRPDAGLVAPSPLLVPERPARVGLVARVPVAARGVGGPQRCGQDGIR
jgi:hypothetical protein